jgi:hypothetical protein
VSLSKKRIYVKGYQRSYSDSDCEEMAFIFLYFKKISLVEIARQYKVFKKGTTQPNNSYARELVHKFLKRHKSKSWIVVDSCEADEDHTTPSREALADKIVSFFPDLVRYKELMVVALEFESKSIEQEILRNIEMNAILKAKLGRCLEDIRLCKGKLNDNDIVNM